jgi:hypothetical protein
MAAKTAVKKQSGPPPRVLLTGKTCFECGRKLMSNEIWAYREITFEGFAKTDVKRYTCKQHAKRA